jgi:hypothetical protein
MNKKKIKKIHKKILNNKNPEKMKINWKNKEKNQKK